MRLYLGGYAQGKLQYVLEQYKTGPLRVVEELPRGEGDGEIIVVNRFHDWFRARMEQGGCPERELDEFLSRYPECLIISDEIGNGIVPLEAGEREYRERLGRALVDLAARAEGVERILCGIAQKIK